MIKIQTDTKDQPYIEWEQAVDHPAGFKRAWIQRKTDPEVPSLDVSCRDNERETMTCTRLTFDGKIVERM
jgi:hypothetical protein